MRLWPLYSYLIWAVVAAFGDNLAEVARRAAVPLALPEAALSDLQALGKCLIRRGPPSPYLLKLGSGFLEHYYLAG